MKIQKYYIVKTFVIIMTFCHYDLPKRDLLYLEDEKINKCTNDLLKCCYTGTGCVMFQFC